jgi:hypothetical protein
VKQGFEMADRLNDLATIAALSPNHIGAYLNAKGWADGGAFGAHGRLYRRDLGDEKQELVLPTRSSLTDFTKRMAELVDDLARAENRPLGVVLFDLTLTAFDVIRVRSRDADDYGSVQFAEGIQLCEEARNLLVASARAASADRPRKAWKGRRPESVNEYLQRVRLGQTEKSSFSLTVLSPYAFEMTSQSQISLFAEDAFGRRVTRKFATALQAIEHALAEAIRDPIPAFEHAVEAGVSADFCQALGNLADNDVGIDVSLSWSPAKPVLPALSPSGVQLSLTPRDAAVLKEIARVFARAEPEPDTFIEGIITQISEDPHTFDGSTTIEAAVEGRLRRIQVQFNPADRDVLIDAFRSRTPIRMEGELISEGNRLKLSSPRGLTTVPVEG